MIEILQKTKKETVQTSGRVSLRIIQSSKQLKNQLLLAKLRFETAEDEPFEVELFMILVILKRWR